MPPKKLNLIAAFAGITEKWSPRIAGRVNETAIKLARIEGEFVWHHHDDEDEMFLVVEGELVMRFRDGDVTLGPGEMIIVPHGVEHLPVAPRGASIMLVEREETLNTGNVRNERTKSAIPDL
jgi:mannose-6-phosphate isomerase-like protein (cupin superfamily)